MDKIIIPAGIGIIFTISGLIYKRVKVGLWLKSRRIDTYQKKPKNICGVCGSNMAWRDIRTGENAGKRVPVCSNWPECRRVNWDEMQ